MEYRTLGRTGLQVSVVGVGTAQYRMIPEEQALATLRTAFDLGVNIVHASPDYEGSLDLVAQAVRETQKQVIVCSQGYGDYDHMEYLFQETCRKLGRHTLELFGLACIDDRELLGENVWGSGGQIEFLQGKKRSGQIGHLFCSTHGSADYLKRLIQADVFDVLFFAYNPLGCHLLSYNQKDREVREHLPANEEIIGLAAAANLGVMIMKPLAGGLLCGGKAFPVRSELMSSPKLTAAGVLRHLLERYPGISCVMPGTASPEEARENALAGEPLADAEIFSDGYLEKELADIRGKVCNRCGDCEPLCSKQLPISWLFRAAYVHNTGAMVFETLDQLQYRRLHPWAIAACSSCESRTCHCPHGLDIPALLCRIHTVMLRWERENWLPTSASLTAAARSDGYAASLYSHSLPQQAAISPTGSCTVIVKNTGSQLWRPAGEPIHLSVWLGSRLLARVPLRSDIPPGENGHFSFSLPEVPAEPADWRIVLERQAALPATGRLGRFLRKLSAKQTAETFFDVTVERRKVDDGKI